MHTGVVTGSITALLVLVLVPVAVLAALRLKREVFFQQNPVLTKAGSQQVCTFLQDELNRIRCPPPNRSAEDVSAANGALRSDVNIAGSLNVQRRLFFGDGSFGTAPTNANSTDPYFLEKISAPANHSHLRLTINDDADESFQIWGNSCATGNCASQGTMAHRFGADGTATVKKLRLGNKWVMSGVGDRHANDDWLRLFGVNEAGYHGGFAAGRLWTQQLQNVSDARLKRDIRDVRPDEAQRLMRLRPTAFRFKSDGQGAKERYGFIAQEAASLYPDSALVSEGPDGFKSLSYNDVVPLLVANVQQERKERDSKGLCLGDVCLTREDLQRLKHGLQQYGLTVKQK